jgi:hypothetical protein
MLICVDFPFLLSFQVYSNGLPSSSISFKTAVQLVVNRCAGAEIDRWFANQAPDVPFHLSVSPSQLRGFTAHTKGPDDYQLVSASSQDFQELEGGPSGRMIMQQTFDGFTHQYEVFTFAQIHAQAKALCLAEPDRRDVNALDEEGWKGASLICVRLGPSLLLVFVSANAHEPHMLQCQQVHTSGQLRVLGGPNGHALQQHIFIFQRERKYMQFGNVRIEVSRFDFHQGQAAAHPSQTPVVVTNPIVVCEEHDPIAKANASLRMQKIHARKQAKKRAKKRAAAMAHEQTDMEEEEEEEENEDKKEIHDKKQEEIAVVDDHLLRPATKAAKIKSRPSIPLGTLGAAAGSSAAASIAVETSDVNSSEEAVLTLTQSVSRAQKLRDRLATHKAMCKIEASRAQEHARLQRLEELRVDPESTLLSVPVYALPQTIVEEATVYCAPPPGGIGWSSSSSKARPQHLACFLSE